MKPNSTWPQAKSPAAVGQTDVAEQNYLFTVPALIYRAVVHPLSRKKSGIREDQKAAIPVTQILLT